MTYKVVFSSDAERSMKKWKKSSPVLFKKLQKILLELMEHPRTGTGHPEALVGGGDVMYSRRITGQHRIVYEIQDERVVVVVISVEKHYSDK